MMPQKKLVPFKIYFKGDQVFQIVTKNYFKMYQFKRRHLNVSNRSEIFQKTHVLVKIVVLKNFSIFTGKHLCWSLFLMKSHRPVTLLKERFQHVFSCEYGEVFKNCFFHRTPTLESLSH